jgi:hypothetical protein
MLSRREFLNKAQAIGASPLFIAACSSQEKDPSYLEAVSSTWRKTASFTGSKYMVNRELVRLACLAPSSHNTQCWQFGMTSGSISITPDFTRKLAVVDPDNHHLFVSLGCATENLTHAALAHGLHCEVQFDGASPKGEISVILEPTKAVSSLLFDSITERQCTRSVFDGLPVSASELTLLSNACKGTGVKAVFVTERALLERVLELVVQGNTSQLDDVKFVEELKRWIRFSGREAVVTGDGLYSASSGNKTLPRWLGGPLFDLFFNKKSENDKYAAQVRSSAGIAIFYSELNDQKHWLEVGRCYERFALQATALGIRNAFINQPVEVPILRDQLATYLGISKGRADLVVRFGRSPVMPRSLRRPLNSVLTLVS